MPIRTGCSRRASAPTRRLPGARQAAADLLGAKPDEIVFGANMTSLTFHLSRSLARELKAGDEIVVTRLDHDANVAPWVALARDTGASSRWPMWTWRLARWTWSICVR